MQYVPATQVFVPVTGTYVGLNTGTVVGSAERLAGGDYMDVAVTGSYAYLDGCGGRPPLGAGTGTVAMSYTANLGVGVFEGISGCFCDVDIIAQRDYMCIFTVTWNWASTNWAVEYFGLWANGSATGIFPGSWRGCGDRAGDANATTTWYRTQSGFFILPNWRPGRYRFQLTHTPNNSQADRYIRRASMSIL